MGRLMGLLFLLFYFLIACKDGKRFLSLLGFILLASPRPPPLIPPTCQ